MKTEGMTEYPLPANFDGGKFAKRYGLDTLKQEFWSDGTFLYVPSNLPDNPPIFEPCDAKPDVKAQLDAVKSLPDLIAILKNKLT